MYGFLADVVMILHFGFILLVVFGGLLALRWRQLALVHLPAVLWALFLELWEETICPLTPLEQSLRQRAGELPYTGGFVDHYLGLIIYPNLTGYEHTALGVALFLFTVAVYWGVWRRWRLARRQ